MGLGSIPGGGTKNMVGWPSGLGGGLQNLLHQFESDSDLNKIHGCGATVAYGSPKPLMGVRISPSVRMVLWCNGLAHETTDFGVWVRVLIELLIRKVKQLHWSGDMS